MRESYGYRKILHHENSFANIGVDTAVNELLKVCENLEYVGTNIASDFLQRVATRPCLPLLLFELTWNFSLRGGAGRAGETRVSSSDSKTAPVRSGGALRWRRGAGGAGGDSRLHVLPR